MPGADLTTGNTPSAGGWSRSPPNTHRSSIRDVLFLPLLSAHRLVRDGIMDVGVLRALNEHSEVLAQVNNCLGFFGKQAQRERSNRAERECRQSIRRSPTASTFHQPLTMQRVPRAPIDVATRGRSANPSPRGCTSVPPDPNASVIHITRSTAAKVIAVLRLLAAKGF